MITNGTELHRAVAQVGLGIQDINDYLNAHPNESGRIRFPRGVLRTAAFIRSHLRFLEDQTLKINVSYAMMLYDVLKWLLTRTDLAGTARDMVIKNAIVLLGSIAESLAVGGTAGVIGKKHKFKARTERMVQHEIISEELKVELDWLWDTRGGIHIYEMEGSEYDRYTIDDYERARRTAQKLRDALDVYWMFG